MQLLPILLIAVILAADAGLSFFKDPLIHSHGITATAVILPMLIILLVQWIVTKASLRRLKAGKSLRPIITVERMSNTARIVLLLLHAFAVLGLGWLDLMRSMIGDVILLDELLTMLPALGCIFGTWWLQYPMEQRVREALIIRRLDEGRPIYPMPSRQRYVWRQAQLQLFLLLVPILIIVGLSEIIDDLVVMYIHEDRAELVGQLATLAAGITVFLFAPLLMKWLLSTVRMASGELRDDLMEICRRHRVRVRELLVWKTDGTMINAAVMGLIGPLRFVLITDALLESMKSDEVRAVMAHEIGHVRRHHMPWLVASLIAILLLTDYAIIAPLIWLQPDLLAESTSGAKWIDLSLSVVILIILAAGFGWVSRRFERQADTFAAQHLSGMGQIAPGAEPEVITPDAVGSIRSALNSICRLNSINLRRRSWRHGSIAWRMEYLDSIVGRPIRALPIDRQIRRIKLATSICLISIVGYESYRYWTYDPGEERSSMITHELQHMTNTPIPSAEP